MRVPKLLGGAGAAALVLAAVSGTVSSAAPVSLALPPFSRHCLPNGVKATSVTARSKGWTVTLSIGASTVKTGATLPATLTFVNKTGHKLRVSGCETDATFGVGLAKPGTPYSPISGVVACWTTLRPGTTVLHRTIYAGLATGGNLPTGRYHTAIEWAGTPRQLPHSGPLYVTVTA
jgi:hypothetical protein